MATTVDEYMEALPEEARATLEKVRKAIRSAAPKAEEVISYQIPTFKQNGALVAFAAFRNHCSLFTTSHALMKVFAEKLEPYKTSGITIQFPFGKPLPAALVKDIVKERIRENEERVKSHSRK